jgi:hypothetical protein
LLVVMVRGKREMVELSRQVGDEVGHFVVAVSRKSEGMGLGRLNVRVRHKQMYSYPRKEHMQQMVTRGRFTRCFLQCASSTL